jgi:hypothetical protein
MRANRKSLDVLSASPSDNSLIEIMHRAFAKAGGSVILEDVWVRSIDVE